MKYNQVKAAALEYFKGDEFASDVWPRKYALKDSEDEYHELTPDDMHHRLAKEFARIELKYPNPLTEEEIFSLFENFKYIIPQGRVMAGLGANESYRSLSNCLVLPTPNDSYSSIMYTDTMLVNAAKRGCGYGIDLSKLRPKGVSVKNASNTSTGIVPFMERFSNSTREVGQENRRGACLLGLDIKHPQSMEFAKSKIDTTKITGANISLKIKDDFLKAVESNSDFNLEFNDKIYEIVNAKEYWKSIVEVIRNTSEPGAFFWDKITNYDPASAYPQHAVTLTNACGEQPMGTLDSCRLIVINLFSFIDNPFTENATFNKDKFIDVVKKQLRIGDDLVDLEIEYIDRILNKIKEDKEPEEEKVIELSLWKLVKEKAIRGRRVGCGLTGLGDMLAAMNIQYGSEESLVFIEEMAKLKMKSELQELVQLSKERGAFPDFNIELEFPKNKPSNSFYSFISKEFKEEVEEMKIHGRRNINWNTIAPVGTTSILTQTTSGCEPTFNVAYKRRKKSSGDDGATIKDKNGDLWKEYNVFHHKFIDWWIVASQCKPDQAIKILNECNDTQLQEIIAKSPYHNSTANNIDWINRIKIQGILQKYTTSAISSTVNLPENVTTEEVEQIIMEAWKSGCKGITIYRDKSRDGVLVSNSKEETKLGKRPKKLPCDIHHVSVLGKKYYVLVGLLDNKPFEIFAFAKKDIQIPQIRKDGFLIKTGPGTYSLKYNGTTIENITKHFNHLEEDAFTRMVSLLLRRGVPTEDIVDQIDKSYSFISGFYKAISRVLAKNYIKNGEISGSSCPNCGATLQMIEGCKSCSCGYSACS